MTNNKLLKLIANGTYYIYMSKLAKQEQERSRYRLAYLKIKRELAKSLNLTYNEVDDAFLSVAIDNPISALYRRFKGYMEVRDAKI